MPITAERKTLYPKDWKAISLSIRKRAGWVCEGSPAYPNCRAVTYESHPVTGSKVILTVAHLDHDPKNCDPANLKAWCQRCHLTYDAGFHALNAVRTRRAKSPQLDLVDMFALSPKEQKGE
jgi:5-methylcytosine-specific restriction endonuclease McrA